ncbi:hypothetical protein IWQ61_006218 [Dispira simplex]|nr:hypothetical protein IWQ61_006218 [Dispira simplex]
MQFKSFNLIALVGTALCASLGSAKYHFSSNKNHFGTDRQYIIDYIKTEMAGQLPQDISYHDALLKYFAFHDTNDDNLLDGHELRLPWKKGFKREFHRNATLQEIDDRVDSVLEDDDINGDGMIDFDEYWYSMERQHLAS